MGRAAGHALRPGESTTIRASMSENTYDLIVIGAGPGGYVAAIRAQPAWNARRLH